MGSVRGTGISSAFFTEWAAQNRAHVPPVERAKRVIKHGARWVVGAGLAGLFATTVVVPGSSASADPSAQTWYRLRMCESSNNYAIDTGNDHYGAYQFDLPTWRSVGGSGYPNKASKAEQDARALILYRRRGWQPWQCASILGLREDRDARSGRVADIVLPRAGTPRPAPAPAPAPTPAPRPAPTGSSVPGFPGGSHWYTYGEWNSQIKRFQDQMHRRGYFPVGTGEYGPNTLKMVKQLQRLNGLVPNGYIGPNTWRLAWTGRYRTP
jgi:peptidoglycan hydrolase-like protein with peptidoglycan-binding domain